MKITSTIIYKNCKNVENNNKLNKKLNIIMTLISPIGVFDQNWFT